MSTSAPWFLFLDLETGGLNAKTDPILEVAWCLTNEVFVPISSASWVVEPEDWSMFHSFWRNQASDVVKEMHDYNGLYLDLTQGTPSRLGDIYDNLADDLQAVPKNTDVHLAGRSVHFDKEFLMANDGDFLFAENAGSPLISHRVFDVRSIRTFLQLRGEADEIEVKTSPSTSHRAMDDVRADIEYAKVAVSATLGAPETALSVDLKR